MGIQQPKKLKILLIGEICTDLFYYGTINRISPEAPVPIFDIEEVRAYDGMSGNVKSNLAGLGFDIIHFYNENNSQIVKSRYIDKKFNQHIIRVDNKPNVKPINLKSLEKLCNENKDISAIIISDYDKGFIKNSKIENLISLLNKMYPDKKIFVDTKKTNVSNYKNCVLKLNSKEFKLCRSTIPKSSKTVVTMGKNGSMHENKIYPVEKAEVFDVSGAGDTFISALVKKYLEVLSIDESMSFANACASYVVKKSGTYAITAEDLSDINKKSNNFNFEMKKGKNE
jgi:D-beta-D-heptose 7-phosphate kinase/D-beta-D-heptose 1-phosphate adenosyltransferase